jgi:hypothetical protein
LAAHKQNKSTNPQQTETDLEISRYNLSMDDRQPLHSIDTKTIQDIETPVKNGLQRHIARHNKTVLIRETLTERI